MSDRNFVVSIVVATYNRANLLGEALESLVSLEVTDHFSYEIIVIDDASTDPTRDIVEEFVYKSKVPIQYYFENGKGVARARNRGIKEASGEWIAFFDDDQIAKTCWLKELLAAAEKTLSLCVGGQVHLLFPEKNTTELPAFCRALLGETYHGNSLKEFTNKILPGTGNVMINRTIFKTLAPFDESLVQGGEDTEFFRRMRSAGFEMWYTPKALLYHVTPSYRLTRKYLTWTALRHGANYAHFDYRAQGLAKVVSVCILRMAQVLFISGPYLFFARLQRDHSMNLECLCRIQKAVGYMRETLFLIAPKIFTQKSFYDRIQFRQERHGFDLTTKLNRNQCGSRTE